MINVSQISQLQEELGQYWADHCDYARCGSEVATIRLAHGLPPQQKKKKKQPETRMQINYSDLQLDLCS